MLKNKKSYVPGFLILFINNNHPNKKLHYLPSRATARRKIFCLYNGGLFWEPDGHQNAPDEIGRGGRASVNQHIDWNYLTYRSDGGVGASELAATNGAISGGNNHFGIGYGIVGHFQGDFHVTAHRPGDQQEIGMPGRRDKMNSEALQIIIGIVHGMDFQLAGVAGPRIHLADGQ
jgi:hypothetical protein